MPEFFDYDPLTGTTYRTEYEEDTGKMHISTEQDVSAALDYAASIRNQGLADKGIKAGLWKYAVLPASVQLKLRQMGLDISSKDPAMLNRVLKAIDEHFPAFKLTDKRHRVQNVRHA